MGELLQKLQHLGGTRFSLQYGETDDRLVDIQPNPLEDMEGHINFISCLDRVVSVTQTAVHEAGALGIPCDVIKPPRGSGDVNPALWYYGIGDCEHLVYGNCNVFQSIESYKPL